MYFALGLNRDCCQRCNVAASCLSNIVLSKIYYENRMTACRITIIIIIYIIFSDIVLYDIKINYCTEFSTYRRVNLVKINITLCIR